MIQHNSFKNPKVAVLLSTYNGQKHLSELLDSLLSQNYLNYHIYVRDDGSSDDTLRILEEISATSSKINLEFGANLGCVGSFLKLLQMPIDADIIMFCDQDDVWLPGKIATAANVLVQNGLNKPALFHTDLIIVDENLRTIASSFMRHQNLYLPEAHDIEVLTVQNCVVGCTTAITAPLANLAKIHMPDVHRVAMHDWWLALLAKTQGQLIFESKAEILYRQHDLNVSGARAEPVLRKVYKQFTHQGIQRINNYRERISDQASTFLTNHEIVLDDRSKAALVNTVLLHPSRGFISTLKAFRSGLRFQNSYMNLTLIFTSIITRLFFHTKYRAPDINLNSEKY